MLLHKYDFFKKLTYSVGGYPEDISHSCPCGEVCSESCPYLDACIIDQPYCYKFNRGLEVNDNVEPVKDLLCGEKYSSNKGTGKRCDLGCRGLISDDSGCYCESYDVPLEQDDSCLPVMCCDCEEDEKEYEEFKKASQKRKDLCFEKCPWLEGNDDKNDVVISKPCNCVKYDCNLARVYLKDQWMPMKCERCIGGLENKGVNVEDIESCIEKKVEKKNTCKALKPLHFCEDNCPHVKYEGSRVFCEKYNKVLGQSNDSFSHEWVGIKCEECEEDDLK